MKILLTAFEPYDEWQENSSWLTMVELLREHSPDYKLVTRRYPVDLQALRTKLNSDLEMGFDAVLHLGQAPGVSHLKLEKVALNVAGCVDEQGEELPPIVEQGPLAFRSELPSGRWVNLLRSHHIPAKVSYHAGTFLCNATLYLTHHWSFSHGLQIPAGFVHLPLATEQIAQHSRQLASLPTATLARGVQLILDDMARQYSSTAVAEQLA